MKRDLSKIKYIVMDVDGTMTDAGIYYDDNGNELKKFYTRDAAGFFAANTAGIHIVVLTGRECGAVLRRMQDMHVEFIFQNIKNKKEFLDDFMSKHNILKEEIAYVGDDLNDLAAMYSAGFVACPNDAVDEIIEYADYIAESNGGHGAIRDVVKYILSERNEWESTLKRVYGY